MRSRATVPPPLDTPTAVRMNPLIAPQRTVQDWPGTYAGMTPEAFVYLCGLGVDAVEQPQVAAIESYCDSGSPIACPISQSAWTVRRSSRRSGNHGSRGEQAWEKISARDASV